MQENVDISRVRNGDATPATKPKSAQVPSDNHNTPDSNINGETAQGNDNSIKGKPVHNDIGIINSSNRSCNRNHSTHSYKASDFGTNDNSKFVYNPGGHAPNSKDSPATMVGNSRSSGNVSYAADTFPTNAHCIEAPVLSSDASDNDEDLAQHACPAVTTASLLVSALATSHIPTSHMLPPTLASSPPTLRPPLTQPCAPTMKILPPTTTATATAFQTSLPASMTLLAPPMPMPSPKIAAVTART